MHTGGEHDPLPLVLAHVQRHDDSLRRGGGPVIVRGVGDFHACQPRDHALVLEDRLQRSLADFRLVRGIGGVELRAGHHEVHDAGNEVVIRARAQETGGAPAVGVPPRKAVQLLQDLLLGHCGEQIEPGETVLLGNVAKQVADRADADCFEHPGAVGLGIGNEAHRVSTSFR